MINRCRPPRPETEDTLTEGKAEAILNIFQVVGSGWYLTSGYDQRIQCNDFDTLRNYQEHIECMIAKNGSGYG